MLSSGSDLCWNVPSLEANLIDFGFPHQRCALDHLALDVLRRLEARPACLECSAAAACHRRVADSLRVANLRVHILDRNAQHLRELLRRCGPRPSDVNRADGQIDRAVVVHIRRGACRARSVHPEAGRHAAPTIGALQRCLVMVVIPRGLVSLQATDHRIHDAVAAPGAFLCGVHNAEFERVDVELVADLVNDLLRCECGAGRARRAIGGRLGLVVHDVVAVKSQILHVIRRVDAVHCRANGRAGVCSRLVLQVCLHCGQPALVC